MLDLILQPLADFIIFIVTKLSYVGVVLAMAIESACIPLPSEIIMPFAGFLVSQGILNFWLTSLAGGIGCLIGSLVAFAIGRYRGEEFIRHLIIKYGKYILVFEYELDEAQEWFTKHGELIAFFSRLLPVIRTFISLPAGISQMNVKTFSFYTFVGSFIWSTGLTYVGLKLGENWNTLGTYFHKFDLLIVIVGVLVAAWYVHHKLKKHKKYKKSRG